MIHPDPPSDLSAWRTAERRRLIALRQAIPDEQRTSFDAAIIAGLENACGPLVDRIVGAYWPLRGEPDLRPWFRHITAAGGRVALPVVVDKNAPLTFRTWCEGEPLEPGFSKIPEPAGGQIVNPDILIAPAVGFDAGCYRLGYGGGFYDRTLEARKSLPHVPVPRVIGVAYEITRIPTIYPQAHDLPLDGMVTEHGYFQPCN